MLQWLFLPGRKCGPPPSPKKNFSLLRKFCTNLGPKKNNNRTWEVSPTITKLEFPLAIPKKN